jgi:hypothetical protein
MVHSAARVYALLERVRNYAGYIVVHNILGTVASVLVVVALAGLEFL